MTTFGLYGARLSLAVWRHFTCYIFFVFTYYVVLSLKNKYTILYYTIILIGTAGCGFYRLTHNSSQYNQDSMVANDISCKKNLNIHIATIDYSYKNMILKV